MERVFCVNCIQIVQFTKCFCALAYGLAIVLVYLKILKLSNLNILLNTQTSLTT